MSASEATEFPAPDPLPYQREVVAFLKDSEPELWAWASSADVREGVGDDTRTQLLKNTYRLDADAHPELAARCTAMAARLNVAVPITLYQAQGGLGLNASICCLPNEAHIVFTGPILATLKGAELDALLAHELAHHRLWTLDGGDFLIADRLLFAAANDPRAASGHVQTARRFRQYTEVFADRGALAGSGDLHAAVAALVKTETGLPDVSAASYLRQADEIFSREDATAKGLDHPETFIRARALRMWAENDDALNEWLTRVIEGPLALDELDLAGQRRVSRLTRRFLGELLRPRWFQTTPVLSHARAFFPDFAPGVAPDDALTDELRSDDPALREYFCFLLLDFAVVDRDLEDTPISAALDWSRRLGLAEPFEKLVLKELGLGKRQFNKLKREAAEILAAAEARP